MDKTITYQTIVSAIILAYQEYLAKAHLHQIDERVKAIMDKEHNAFQLLVAGWKNKKYTFSVLFHLEIIAEKVWIQCNNTEFYLADELMEKGVPKEDIVLGFLNENDRAYSGFAVS